jgi:hypothetical protein
VLRVNQAKAALLGVAQKDIVEVVRMGLSGENVTPVHDGDAKYEIPVRITLPPRAEQSSTSCCKLKVRARASGRAERWCRCRKWSRCCPPAAREGDLPQGPAAGGVRHRRHGRQAGFAALRHVRHPRGSRTGWWRRRQGGTLDEWFIHQPDDPYAAYSIKWDGEWQVTYETFRDMGAAYAVGLMLIYLLVVAQFKSYLVPLIIMAPIPLTIIGVMPGHACSARNTPPPR